MIKVGQKIKSSRISKKLSIADVSKELNLSQSIIKDIETDKQINIKDSTFYIGHIRSYSRLLEIDYDKIVDDYKEQISYNKINSIKTLAKPNFEKDAFKFRKFIPATLILIIFSTFYSLFVRENDQSIDYALIPDLPENYNPIIEQANLNNADYMELDTINDTKFINESTDYISANASTNFSKITNNSKITLKILNSTWLQLRDESNNIILSQLMEKDEEFSYNMELGYNITAGNAGNILVLINNDVRGKIGKYGEVVDSLILDSNFNN